VSGFETEVVDTYIHKDMYERTNFEFVNEEIWKFLSERYDVDHTVKRFYANKSAYFTMCEIDTRFNLVPVFLVKADDLYAGSVAEQFKICFV